MTYSICYVPFEFEVRRYLKFIKWKSVILNLCSVSNESFSVTYVDVLYCTMYFDYFLVLR